MKILFSIFLFLCWSVLSAAMVKVPGGTFTPLFGSGPATNLGAKEKKSVKVRPYLLDDKPVTVAEYNEFVRYHPEWRKSRVKKIFSEKTYLKTWNQDVLSEEELKEKGSFPVTDLSWYAARSYARAAGKRLPTVAEWEYAATKFGFPGDREAILKWYAKPGSQALKAAGTASVNTLGIRDLYGQIWEWTEDFSGEFISSDSREKGEAMGEKFCGSGSLGASDFSDYGTFMRYAFRSSLKADYALSRLGFRCAADLKP